MGGSEPGRQQDQDERQAHRDLRYAGRTPADYRSWEPVKGEATRDKTETSAALLDDDFRPTPAGEIWQDLVSRQLRTDQTATTDADGSVDLHGHRGDYAVEVDGRTIARFILARQETLCVKAARTPTPTSSP
jgi:hypothetical protein